MTICFQQIFLKSSNDIISPNFKDFAESITFQHSQSGSKRGRILVLLQWFRIYDLNVFHFLWIVSRSFQVVSIYMRNIIGTNVILMDWLQSRIPLGKLTWNIFRGEILFWGNLFRWGYTVRAICPKDGVFIGKSHSTRPPPIR